MHVSQLSTRILREGSGIKAPNILKFGMLRRQDELPWKDSLSAGVMVPFTAYFTTFFSNHLTVIFVEGLVMITT
jgi:hypothetical protein